MPETKTGTMESLQHLWWCASLLTAIASLSHFLQPLYTRFKNNKDVIFCEYLSWAEYSTALAILPNKQAIEYIIKKLASKVSIIFLRWELRCNSSKMSKIWKY
jgi:hypothetical protein